MPKLKPIKLRTKNTTWYRHLKKENEKLLGEIFNKRENQGENRSIIKSTDTKGEEDVSSKDSVGDSTRNSNFDYDDNQDFAASLNPVSDQENNCLLGVDESEASNSSYIAIDSNAMVSGSACSQVECSSEEKLKAWAISNNITHSALDGLLNILSNTTPNSFTSLPKTSRTFLMTPTKLPTKKVDPGEYYHFGIQTSLEFLFKKLKLQHPSENLYIGINIDGLPLAKSSNSQVYPILGIYIPTKDVFMIGIYHGYEKPKDFNVLLSDFVNEASYLTRNGIKIFEKNYSFKISMYLFDAVAKASVLFIKGHSGYSSCTKCTQEGEYIKDRICFPDLQFTKRNHKDFVNQTDFDHHKGHTVLLDILNIDIIADVPLDYMHLVALGVVKKLLCGLWCWGVPPHKLSGTQIINISKKLVELTPYIPSEFARKPRSLNEVKRWKATEFRQFLLYTGPLVLKSVLSTKKYLNFLTLSVAITLLLSDKLCMEYVDYAESLLIYFIKTVKNIYGDHLLSHNFHNLLHLADDVRKFGSLENFSNFSCENFLQSLLKLVRKHDKPLQQIVRRYYENLNNININIENNINKQKRSNNEANSKNIIFKNFKLSSNTLNNSCCALKDGSIVIIKDIIFSAQQKPDYIVGQKYKSISSFFNFPCSSSLLKIFYVEELDQTVHHWEVDEIDYKAVCLPHENGFVIFPLIHSNN